MSEEYGLSLKIRVWPEMWWQYRGISVDTYGLLGSIFFQRKGHSTSAALNDIISLVVN